MSNLKMILLTAACFFAFTSMAPLSRLSPLHAEEGEGKSEKGGKRREKADKGEKSDNSEKSNGDTYSVVQVGDEVKVVKSSEVKGLQKKVEDDFQASLKAYRDAKQAASKAKKKFNDTMPVKPTFRVVAPAIKTEEQANQLRDKEVQKMEKQKKKGKEEKGKK